MEQYQKRWVEGRLRLQFELVVEPDVNKALTLEQMRTVFRRSLRPDTLTWEETEAAALDPAQFFSGRGGETAYQAIEGTWKKEGRSVDYYLDDATENNQDGTITVGVVWWDLEREDQQVERWFQELVQAMLEAQDNLRLYGRI